MPLTHAEFVEAALRKRYPDLEITVDERRYGQALRVTIQRGDRRWALFTPDEQDYKSHEDRWWVHRFTELMTPKFGPPAA